MPRGYRRAIVATLGGIAAGLLGLAGYQLYDASEQQHSYYAYQPARQPILPNTAPGQLKAPQHQPDCKKPQSKSDAELCSQWSAVDQAMEANRLSSVNVKLSIFVSLLTFIGTVFVGWTLMEQRHTSRRELRAYVFPESVGITDGYAYPERQMPKGEIGGAIIIKNTGQTPAYDVCHWGEVAIADCENENTLVAPSIPISDFGSSVPPGGTINKLRNLGRALTPEEKAAVEAGKSAIYFYGRIDYRDAFNQRQWATYRFSWNGKFPIPKDMLMNFARSGNAGS